VSCGGECDFFFCKICNSNVALFLSIMNSLDLQETHKTLKRLTDRYPFSRLVDKKLLWFVFGG